MQTQPALANAILIFTPGCICRKLLSRPFTKSKLINIISLRAGCLSVSSNQCPQLTSNLWLDLSLATEQCLNRSSFVWSPWRHKGQLPARSWHCPCLGEQGRTCFHVRPGSFLPAFDKKVSSVLGSQLRAGSGTEQPHRRTSQGDKPRDTWQSTSPAMQWLHHLQKIRPSQFCFGSIHPHPEIRNRRIWNPDDRRTHICYSMARLQTGLMFGLWWAQGQLAEEQV